jgi:hypothetical protein
MSTKCSECGAFLISKGVDKELCQQSVVSVAHF